MFTTARAHLALTFVCFGVALGGCLAGTTEPRRAGPARVCVGECLAGVDPYDAGCDADATTVASAEVVDDAGHTVAKVDLRWSARCDASWARAVRLGGAPGALVANVASAGRRSAFEHPTDGEVWTDMVPGGGECATASAAIRRADRVVFDARAASCAGARADRSSVK
jgi:hypothetical protein